MLAESTKVLKTQIEYDTYDFINLCLTNADLLQRPFKSSNYYADPVISIYHICRLNELAPDMISKELILKTIHQIDQESLNPIQTIMLNTAAHRIGMEAPALELNISEIAHAASTHSCFIAPMLGSTTSPFLNALASNRLSWLTYHCEAYCYALALENLAFAKAN
jgi:hypothetical protein